MKNLLAIVFASLSLVACSENVSPSSNPEASAVLVTPQAATVVAPVASQPMASTPVAASASM